WKEGKTLFTGEFQSTSQGKIALPAHLWYKNGWYLIEIKTRDAQGNEVIEKKFTHVWAPGKKEPTQVALVNFTEKDVYQPGEALEIWIGSAVENPYLLKEYDQGQLSANPLKIQLKEEHRGGLNFSWLYVYNNRVYSQHRHVSIPWSNKELEIEWATH